jgi:hypothetical protein
MDERERRELAAEIQFGQVDRLSDEAVAEIVADLDDLPHAEAVVAIRVCRVSGWDDKLPSAALVRRRWAELSVAAPPATEACQRIHEVYEEHRARAGARLGAEAAQAQLEEEHVVLGAIVRAYAGPPPYEPRKWRSEWEPKYEREVAKEIQRRVTLPALRAGL